MKINDIEMQYQSDSKYSNLVMTFPKWQSAPDTIKQYGCLLCAKLNAYNLFNKDNKFLTIEQFNNLVIQHRGYNYLFYLDHNMGDLEKTKTDCYKKESFQIPSIINWILGIKKEDNKYTGKIDIESTNDFYIIKTKYKDTGHYSLIIDEDKSYFDSYDGVIKPATTTILDIIKITF